MFVSGTRLNEMVALLRSRRPIVARGRRFLGAVEHRPMGDFSGGQLNYVQQRREYYVELTTKGGTLERVVDADGKQRLVAVPLTIEARYTVEQYRRPSVPDGGSLEPFEWSSAIVDPYFWAEEQSLVRWRRDLLPAATVQTTASSSVSSSSSSIPSDPPPPPPPSSSSSSSNSSKGSVSSVYSYSSSSSSSSTEEEEA